MSDIIRLLPDSEANKIAAGEVIQRPASVIKELVENAIDAGATEVQIVVKDAGRTLIQVIDNGKGMTETDARMAFERHATSKIRTAADLSSLHTMGFRGEALPSICAISQVELRTRTAADAIGVRLCLNASKVEVQEPCVVDVGSNFMVKNIFFNVPARRKFLKSDSVERANIMREFERLALVNFPVRFSISMGERTLTLPAANFRQRIADIWKNNLNPQLLKVEVNTSIVKISGFISRPEHARKRNPLQYLIVNGRNMKHPYFHKAILNCYEKLVPSGEQPCYFIRFEVDPETIDVNIHPTKTEIKFENEREIWPILSGAVRAALGKFSAVPSIDFNSDVLPVEALNPGDMPAAPRLDTPTDYNPFDIASPAKPSRRPVSQTYRPTRSTKEWESLYADFMKSGVEETQKEAEEAQHEQQSLPEMPEKRAPQPSRYMQLAEKYILTQSRDGLLVIDQYRAHLKVLFEKYIQLMERADHSTQRLVFPQKLELDESQGLALEGIEDDLTRIGFALTRSDDGVWSVEGVPSELSRSDPTDMLMRILEQMSDDTSNYGNESPVDAIRRNLAMAIARATAITGGRPLSESEMESLVGELFSLPDPARTPSGGIVYRLLSGSYISSLFV